MLGTRDIAGSLSAAVTILLVFARPAPSVAAPEVLDPGGLPVCAAAGEQLNPCVVPAADGAAIVVWLDRRRGGSLSDVYALSVAANGTVTPGWPDDGRVLCASGAAQQPFAVSDGSGGALVFWADGRPDQPPYDYQLYSQRVNADGNLAAGWPADGLKLTTNGPYDLVTGVLDVFPDGSGGAYVAMKRAYDFANTTNAAITRITSDGAYVSGWSSGGKLVKGNTYLDQAMSGRFAEDPAQGVFFALRWSHGIGYETIFGGTLARIAAGGTVAWTANLPLHPTGFGEWLGIQEIAIARDGSGGCFASWLDGFYESGFLVYKGFGQHRTAAGAALWPADSPSPVHREAQSDGGDGAFLIGKPPGVTELEVHRRNADGSIPPGWTSDGVTLSTPMTLGSVVTGGRDGRVFVCWSDVRPGEDSNIHACEVDSAGMIVSGWEPDGTIISGATGDQTRPAFAMLGPSRMVIAWEDARTGSRDIRATRLDVPTVNVAPGSGAVAGLAIRGVHPNPARSGTRIAYTLPAAGAASIAVFDLAGRQVRRVDEPSANAGHRQSYLDLSGLASGVYVLELRHRGNSVARRVAVLN